MDPSALDGVLVIDKPRGPTSHDIVTRLRRTLRVRAVGHAGTLDPMATGVLVVAIGEATKLVPWLTAHDKSYEATISLGIETDTLDAEGRQVHRQPPGDELLAALRDPRAPDEIALLRAALDQERARTAQVPPAYSAIRTGGERAFDLARRGEPPSLSPRPVVVQRLEVLARSADPPSLTIAIDVGKGYYVRALARDLATALGTVGHLIQLRRTRSGCFFSEECISIDAGARTLRDHVEPLEKAAARALPVARLTDAGERDARHGRAVLAPDIDASKGALGGPCAWLDERGTLVAVGRLDEDGRGRVLRGFSRATLPGRA
jgi:tRNA pseudouridine55 synthase